MRFDRFTLKSREALEAAKKLAEERQHQEIAGLHLLLALLEQSEGIVTPLLKKIGNSPEALRDGVEDALRRLPQVSGARAGENLTKELTVTLEKAFSEAERLKDEYARFHPRA